MPKRRNPSEARIYSVRVAVREVDLRELRAESYARGISVSLLLFRRLMSTRPLPTALDAKIAAELGRVGSNLNQIARHANSGKVVGVGAGELQGLYDIMRELRMSLLGGAP